MGSNGNRFGADSPISWLWQNAAVVDTEALSLERHGAIHEAALYDMSTNTLHEYLLTPQRSVFIAGTGDDEQDVTKLRSVKGEQIRNKRYDTWAEAVQDMYGDDLEKTHAWLHHRRDLYPHLGISEKHFTKEQLETLQAQRLDQMRAVDANLSMTSKAGVTPEEFFDPQTGFIAKLRGKTAWIANAGYDCLHGDTLIKLKDGTMIPIKSFGFQEKIQGFEPEDGPLRDSTLVEVKGIPGQQLRVKPPRDCREFRTKNGIPLVCSDNHLLLTDKGWKKAKSVTVGDWLLIGDPSHNGDQPLGIPTEQLYLFGALLGSAHRSALKQRQFMIRYHGTEEQAILDGLAAYGGTGYYWEHCSPRTLLLRNRNPQKENLLRKITQWLEDPQLHVNRVSACDHGGHRAFLDGLFWLHANQHRPYSSNDETLLNMVHAVTLQRHDLMPLRQGNTLTLTAEHRVPKTICSLDQLVILYQLVVPHLSTLWRREVAEQLSYFQNHNAQTWDHERVHQYLETILSHAAAFPVAADHILDRLPDRSTRWTPVTVITPVGKHPVYDIEVSTHEFWANGYVVHNTKELSVMARAATEARDPQDGLKQFQEIQEEFETYRPDSPEFGYITGVDVQQARTKAKLSGDWRGVWKAYLADEQRRLANPTEKVAVKDIQDLMRSALSYGRGLGLLDTKTDTVNVDITGRLMGILDGDLEAMAFEEAHRAGEDTVISEGPMFKRAAHMNYVMQQVEEGTAAGREYLTQAARGEGDYYKIAKYMSALEQITPMIEQVRAEQRFERALQDITEKGVSVQTAGHRGTYPMQIQTAAGTEEIRQTRSVYEYVNDLDELQQHLETMESYPTANLEDAKQKILSAKAAGINMDAMLQQRKEEITSFISEARAELAEIKPTGRIQTRSQQFVGAATDFLRDATVQKRAGIVAGVGAAAAVATLGTLMAGEAAVDAVFEEKQTRQIYSPTYDDWAAQQQQYMGHSDFSGERKRQYSDFGSPWRGPQASAEVLLGLSVGSQSKRLTAMSQAAGDLRIGEIANRPNTAAGMEAMTQGLERYSSGGNAAFVDTPLVTGHAQARHSFQGNRALARGGRTVGNPIQGGGSLDVHGRHWQDYAQELSEDNRQRIKSTVGTPNRGDQRLAAKVAQQAPPVPNNPDPLGAQRAKAQERRSTMAEAQRNANKLFIQR